MIKAYTFGITALVLFSSVLFYNLQTPLGEVRTPYDEGVCVETVGITVQNGLECAGDNDGELLATVTRSPDCFASFGYQFIWEQDGVEVRNVFADPFQLTDVLSSATSSNGEVPPGTYEVSAFDYDINGGTGNTVVDMITLQLNDTTDPVAQCQDITIQLDANGNASILASDLNDGSTDNCGVASVSASQTDFDCSDLGANNITLTVTDANGNSDTCNAIVTVEDDIAPILSCPVDVTVEIVLPDLYMVPDYFGNGDATVTDNCTNAGDITTTQSPAPGTELGEGTFTVTLTGEDDSGNVGDCTFQLTVDDILGIEDFDFDQLVFVSNPVNDVLIVKKLDVVDLTEAQLFDINGKSVGNMDLTPSVDQYEMDVSHLSQGMYFLKIDSGQGNSTLRLLKL